MTITIKGSTIVLNDRHDLQTLRISRPDLFSAIKTRNRVLIDWAVQNYMDELDRQDALESTGSNGKLTETLFRIEKTLEAGNGIRLWDVKARNCKIADCRAQGRYYECKTTLSGGDVSNALCYDDGINKLYARAKQGCIMHFETEAFTIEMPMMDFLQKLIEYNPDKGLTTWFKWNPARGGKLQMQVIRTSKKKMNYLAAMANA